ncbi:helix-turn-helix domain-containing protein [Pseudogemmobacter sonorensis]|uniref:AraC family transcriptional regulator n=1 Tax=Pseudogemmobacter sonorensis TaxID=2989681 RepID=UPI0036B7C257
MPVTDYDIPVFDTLPGDIYFRHEELAPAEWVAHSHPWGQFTYVSRGVLNFRTDGKNMLSPPQYAIWIPPHFEHASWSKGVTSFRSAYISAEISQSLPERPCALSINLLLKAILDECARLGVSEPRTPQQKRLAAVAIDQILAAERTQNYLPFADSDLLKAILDEARRNLLGPWTTAQIARQFHLTPRTLERRCKAELGIGLGEWRQRLRFTMAIEALNSGRTIQQISYDMGYQSASTFIAMFRRLSGQTPDQYRRSLTRT